MIFQVLLHSFISFLAISNSNAQLMLKTPTLTNCAFQMIYQLGDSFSDTGNFIRLIDGTNSFYANLPYGQDFPFKATGRASNGMLIIDFIALEFGLPLLNPYKEQNANFTHGANFAVAGATALSDEILAKKNIYNPNVRNGSLDIQLGWMSSHFQLSCNNECSDYLKNSLFLVGEIGGNDLFFSLKQGATMEELTNMVPEVVQTIIAAAQTVIDFGADRIVIPGNIPIGCVPSILTIRSTNNSMAYDENHCLKDLNNLAIMYNEHLQLAIADLKKKNPNVILIYGDYYNAYQWLLQNADNHGLDQSSLQKACCGEGGIHNYDAKRHCGNPGVPVCAEPSAYISWDGVHLTEKAYSLIAGRLIEDMLSQLQCQV